MPTAKFDPELYPNLHPIFKACREGDIKEVQRYLDEGISIGIDDENHPSLLATALSFGHIDILRLLISRGLDINDPLNRFGETPLSRAIGERKDGVVKELIACGADLNRPDNSGLTPLFAAAASSNISVLRILLDAGVDVHTRAENGRTAFIEAAISNQPDSLEVLLGGGAKLEDCDARGSTALISTAKRGSFNACRWLLEHGADINAEDDRGKTALEWAKANGHIKVVELLESYLGS